MIAIDSPHPPGMIGILTADLARYPEFWLCLEKLKVPLGTSWLHVSGGGYAANRNVVVDKMTAEHQWLWFIDDDHTFHPDILMRMLDRHVNILQPVCATRKPPYRVYAYRRDHTANGYGYVSADWTDIPTTGISQWDAVGTGGVLIQRNVLDAVGYPWYEEGRTAKDAPGEDLYFCSKAQELGFRAFVDSDNRMGHTSKCTVYPNIHDGEWGIDLDLSAGIIIGVPASIGQSVQYDDLSVKV